MLSEELSIKLNQFLNSYDEQLYNKKNLHHELVMQTLDLEEELYIKGNLKRENELLELFEKEELLSKEIQYLEENKQNAINIWFNETINITKVDTEIGDFTILYENKNTEIVNKEEKIKELEKLIEQKKKTRKNRRRI